MARQGRAGVALAIAAIGSFVAGTLCTVLISLLGPWVADVALKFGSPEYFSLMLMGLVTAAILAQGDMLKSLAMVFLGLLLSMVGSDVDTGIKRFTFGFFELADGIGFVIIAIGVFAIGEIIFNVSDPEEQQVFTSRVGSLYPTLQDMKQAAAPILRGRPAEPSSASFRERGPRSPRSAPT
jgi:TctA family transporter